MNKYITQKEALEIFKKTKSKETDSVGLFTLRFLFNLNDYAKKKLKRRLYSIFEIIGVTKDNEGITLSYTISNIEELSKEELMK